MAIARRVPRPGGGRGRADRRAADERAPRPRPRRAPGTLAVALAGGGPRRPGLPGPPRRCCNAMAGIAATGGSTNGLLHLLAIAREAGVALTLDELTAVAARTPVIASLAPGGRWVAEDLHRAGGTASVIAELDRAPATSTATRRRCRAGRSPAAAAGRARAGRRGRLRRASAPFKPQRRAVLRCAATSRPRAASSSSPGPSACATPGPARVFDSEEACADAVRAGARRSPATCS